MCNIRYRDIIPIYIYIYIYIYVYTYTCIYIYIQRERDIDIHTHVTCVFIYIYIYICIDNNNNNMSPSRCPRVSDSRGLQRARACPASHPAPPVWYCQLVFRYSGLIVYQQGIANIQLLICGIQDFYFEEIRLFQAGVRLEYISME